MGAAISVLPGIVVAAVGHAEADPVADSRADGRPRHLVAERPGAELHTRGNVDDLVGDIQPYIFHGRWIQWLQFGI